MASPGVLHLIDSGGLYGAEQMLLNLVAAQQQAGLRSLILSVGTPDCGEKALEAGARRRGLPVRALRMRAGLNVGKGLEIVRFARREGFNILHSHGYKFNIILGLLPRRLRRLPLVATLHGYVDAGRWSRLRLYRGLERRLLPRLDGVVFVSHAMAGLPSLAGLRLRRSCIIHNGIDPAALERSAADPDALSLRQLLPAAGADATVIGALGRLSAEKGFDLLIRAFAGIAQQHPQLFLVLLGEGPLRARLQEEAVRLGVAERVCMPGFVSPVQRIMGELDIFVMPSLAEGLPMSLLEACALGRRIVATKAGGIPEVLARYPAGRLVAAGDADGLARALDSWLAEGAAGAVNAGLDASFTAAAMAAAYADFYRKLQAG